MHTTATPGGRPRRITPEDVRDLISRRLTAQDVSADRIDPDGEPGDGAWVVRAADGSRIGSLYLTAAYERDDLGRAHHALYMTLYLPVPPGDDCHPYATCRIWERAPHIAEPLEVHMPQPHYNADLLADAQLAQARVLLADLWLSGALTTLWRKVME